MSSELLSKVTKSDMTQMSSGNAFHTVEREWKSTLAEPDV